MSSIDPMWVQALAAILFGLGMATVIGRRNVFFLLIGIELMLNAVNLSFVGFSRVHDGGASLEGQLVPLFVIALAAAEACIALAMVICIVRVRGTLDADAYASMKE